MGAIPQSVSESIPQSVPESVPQALPEPLSEFVPQSVPQSVPEPVPQPLPEPVSQPIPCTWAEPGTPRHLRSERGPHIELWEVARKQPMSTTAALYSELVL